MPFLWVYWNYYNREKFFLSQDTVVSKSILLIESQITEAPWKQAYCALVREKHCRCTSCTLSRKKKVHLKWCLFWKKTFVKENMLQRMGKSGKLQFGFFYKIILLSLYLVLFETWRIHFTAILPWFNLPISRDALTQLVYTFNIALPEL